MSVRSKVLSAAMSVVLTVGLCPAPAFAAGGDALAAASVAIQSDNIASGTWGSCPWEISADGMLTVHPGEGGECGTWGDGYKKSYWDNYRNNVSRVVFAEEAGKKVVLSDASHLFSDMSKIESVDTSGLDTSHATDMSNMFDNCSSLRFLDVSHFDTSNVTSMSSMFADCSALQSLDVSHFVTSNVTSMSYMFYYCESLQALDVTHFDTSKVTDMHSMFDRCSSLTSIDVSHFVTSNVTSMSSMFYDCYLLQSLDMSSFDTSKVTNMWNMFKFCSSLQSLNVSSFNTASVTDMDGMFGCNRSLMVIYVGEGWSTVNVSSSEDMFVDSWKLFGGCGTTYDADYVDAEYACIDAPGAPGYLTDASTLLKPSITDATIAGIPDQAYTGSAIEPVATVSLDGAALFQGTDYFVVYADNTEAGTATLTVVGAGAYGGFKSVTFGIVVSGTWGTCPWKISADGTLTIRSGTGANTGGKSPWADWGTSVRQVKVDGVVTAPADCSELFHLSGAFGSSTRSIDLSGLDTSGVTDMSSMFSNCALLESLDLSPLDTANVTNMEGMFQACFSLKSLNLSSFDTSNVTNMNFMFAHCYQITSLDLSSFDTSKVTVMNWMFWNTERLVAIYAGDMWSTAAVVSSDNMFSAADALVGGDGTVYDTAHVDAGYARIDVEGAPGYLTYKAYTSKRNIARASVAPIPNQIYTGSAIEPAVNMTYGGVLLVAGTDYDVSYRDNMAAGMATAIVTGIGIYKGEISIVFKITPAPSSITLEPQTLAYTGSPLAYSGKVTRSGSSGAVTYAYYRDVACLQPVSASDVREAGTYYVKAALAADTNHSAAMSAAVALVIEQLPAPEMGLAVGAAAKVGGATYKVTSGAAATVSYQAPSKSKTAATIPASVTINGKKYAVTGIAKNAFKKSKAKTVTIKSAKLTKKGVKGCFKDSKVKVVKIKVGSKKANKKAIKKYKKYFTKANCGAKVTVKVG